MSRTVAVLVGDRGPPLTDDEEERVDALVSHVAEALRGLTVHEMAEVAGRILTEQMAWAVLAGQSEMDALSDVLTRMEAYTQAMNTATQVLCSKLLSRPGAAEALVETKRAKLRQPGATPRTITEGRGK